MNWIENKYWELKDIFREYPSVKRVTIFYIVLAIAALIAYLPLLKGIANLNIMGTSPLHTLILDNISILKWGVLAIPALILLWGWCDAEDMYYRLRNRKYGY